MQHRQRQGRGDHRQAAPRPDRHRAAAVRRQRHPLLRPGARAVHAGAAASERERQRRRRLGPPQGADPLVRARRPDRRPCARCAPTGRGSTRPRAGRNAPASSRPMPTAWGWRRSPGRSPARAARPSSSPASTKAGPRARCSRAPPSTCSTACCPAPRRTMRASTCAPCSRACPRCATGPPTAARAGAGCAAAIHIDTGMNRLGMPEGEVEQLAAAPDLLAAFETTLVMSHLACADEPDDPMNERQRVRFEELRAKLPPAPASLANSGGTVPGPALSFRSGAAGHRALRRPRARGQAQPDADGGAARRPDPAGARGGPRRQRSATAPPTRCSAPARIATIAVGYADGFLRALSVATGEAGPVGYIGDYPVPIVGRVSMDFITVDVTSVPPELARRGAWVEVMGAPRHRRRPDRPRRHHRLRAALPARPARLSRLRGGGGLKRHGQDPPRASSCARTAARWRRAGPANAPPAASGTRSIEEADVAAPPGSGLTRVVEGARGRARDAGQDRPTRSRASRPGLPSSTASPAAASCRARRC